METIAASEESMKSLNMKEMDEQEQSQLIFHKIDAAEAVPDESSITIERRIEKEDDLTLESVCEIDQRVKVLATNQLPYKAICKLYMKASNGKTYVGSGWLIDGDKLITAGHCVYSSKKGWKESIIVIPGKVGLSEPYGRYEAEELMTTKGWFSKGSTRFDMGAIKLKKSVSHSEFISPEVMDSSYGEICGYPADRDGGIFQFRMSDNLTKREGRFYYQADTFGGQSGSPLLKDRSTAIGIHNYGGCPNKASDLYSQFIDGVKNWRS